MVALRSDDVSGLAIFETILNKVAEFFDIFDLSFFVAGVICLGALTLQVHVMERGELEARTDAYREELSEVQEALAKARVRAEHVDGLLEDAVDREHDARDAYLEAREDLAYDDISPTSDEGRAYLAAYEDDLENLSAEVAELRTQLLAARGDEALAELRTDAPEDAPTSLVQRYVVDGNLFYLLMSVYVLGLVCFAVGRIVRRMVAGVMYRLVRVGRFLNERTGGTVGWLATLDGPFTRAETMERALEHHRYEERTGTKVESQRALYNELWVLLRESDQDESYRLLKRYWVLAATYDGVAMALLAWAMVIFGAYLGEHDWAGPLIATLVLLSLACFREAQTLVRNQVYEIVATGALRLREE